MVTLESVHTDSCPVVPQGSGLCRLGYVMEYWIVIDVSSELSEDAVLE